MVAVVISSIVFLAVDLTCQFLDIMLLKEIVLEVKVTCREGELEGDVDNQEQCVGGVCNKFTLRHKDS